MVYFPESTLIDTVDGFQCKSYACEHPPGYIIVKPKYIPADALTGEGLKYRFLFEQSLIRFNLFAKKNILLQYLEQFRKKYPAYIYDSPFHKNWFFVVPVDKIKQVHDPRKGLQELRKVPKKDLDSYLTLVSELIDFLTESGVPATQLGITHSTLLGNYTFGKSDIDLTVYGNQNGWKILNYLKSATHPLLRWKSEQEWRDYYQEHKTSESSHFTENEYVYHMNRKRYEGTFGETVFTIFISELEEETWGKWGDESYQPLGLATVKGKVVDHQKSHLRPGYYEIAESELLEVDSEIKQQIQNEIPITRVVTYSIPFIQQAVSGEMLKACGLLELVTPKKGNKYYRIVVGYFDAYVTDRREKEYIKVEA